MVWPSGWAWESGAPYQSHLFMMIVGIYATLGVFVLNAARNPAANLSLIWFTVVSCRRLLDQMARGRTDVRHAEPLVRDDVPVSDGEDDADVELTAWRRRREQPGYTGVR